MAASGTPGTTRGTPTLDALDWVRVFGPLGTEDRSEAEPDGPAWWTFGPPPLVSQRPAGQTAGVSDLTLLELIEVLGEEPAARASRRRPRRRRHARHASPRQRSGSSRWRPATAALALLAPAVAIAGGVGLTRALPGHAERGPDQAAPAGTAIPTGTTTVPTTPAGGTTDVRN